MNNYDYYNTKLGCNLIVSAMLRRDADRIAMRLLHLKSLKGWKMQNAFNEDGGEVTEPKKYRPQR